MAHFAELDINNKVIRVVAVANRECMTSEGIENENVGILFLQKTLGGIWKQTSFNGKIRKNYAGVGFTYDLKRDAFIPGKPFESWILDEDTCQWQAPVKQPIGRYFWNEKLLEWEKCND